MAGLAYPSIPTKPEAQGTVHDPLRSVGVREGLQRKAHRTDRREGRGLAAESPTRRGAPKSFFKIEGGKWVDRQGAGGGRSDF